MSDKKVSIYIRAQDLTKAAIASAKAGLTSLQTYAGSASRSMSKIGGKGTNARLASLAVGLSSIAGKLGKIHPAAQAAALAIAGVAAAFGAFFSRGVKVSSILETAQTGIQALVAQLMDMRDEFGKPITDPAEKFARSAGLAADQLKKLQVAGLQTAASFTELAEAYKTAIGAGANAGLNLDQIREITILTTKAASAIGVPMHQLNQEVRALLSGDIDKDARVAVALNISRAMVMEWRAQNVLAEKLNEKMLAFNVASMNSQTNWEVVKGNISEAVDKLAAAGSAGFFQNLKAGLIDALKVNISLKTGDLDKSLDGVINSMNRLGAAIGSALAGALLYVIDLAKQIGDWFEAHAMAVGRTVNALGVGLGQLVDIVKFLSSIVLAAAQWLVKTQVLAAVFGTISLGLAAAIGFVQALGGAALITAANITRMLVTPFDAFGKKIVQVVGFVNKALAAKVADWFSPTKWALDTADDLGRQGVALFSAAGNRIKNAWAGVTDPARFKMPNLPKIPALEGVTATGTKGAPGAGKKDKAAEKAARDAQREAEKLAKARIKLAEAVAAAEFALEKDTLSRKKKLLEQDFADQKIAIKAFYDERAKLDTQALDLEIKAQKDKIGAAWQAMATLPVSDQTEKKAEIARLVSELTVLERNRGEVAAQASRDATKAMADYGDELLEAKRKLLELQGQQGAAALIAIDQAYAKPRARAELQGDTALLDKLVDTEKSKAKFDELRRQWDQTLADMQITERSADLAMQAGQLTQTALAETLETLHKSTQAKLEQILPGLKEYADTIGDPALRTQVQGLSLDMQQLTLTTDTLGQSAKSYLRDGFVKMWTDVATGAKSAGDAVRDFARNFIAQMQALIAAKLAEKLFDSIMGTSSSGGGGGGSSGGGEWGGLINFASKLLGGFADGGYVSGPGTGTSDSIPARLSNGEFVMRADAVKTLGVDYLKKLNRMPKFAEGGLVGSAPAAPAGGGVRIVNSLDPTIVGDFLGTPDGERVIVNVIRRNRKALGM